MDRDDMLALWRRRLDGEALSDEEERRLHARLAEDEELREELLAEEGIHWRLASIARTDDPRDEFLSTLSRRIEREGARRNDGSLPRSAGGDARGVGRPGRRRSALVWLAAASVLAGFVGLWLLGPGAGGVASIVHAQDAVWSGAGPGERLREDERLELERGSAEIRFDHGASITLEGPSSVSVRGGALIVRFGAIAARLPARRDRFRIETPLSLVRDRGVDLSVTVDRDGSTGFEVLDGVLRVQKKDGSGETLTLASRGLRKARISTREIASGLEPFVTRMTGEGGAFSGRISLAGGSVECRDPGTFERLLDEVAARPSRERLLADWSELSRRFGVGVSSSVSITVEGETLRATGIDEVIRVQEDLDAALGAGATSRSFSGSISVDGVRRVFSSREEFEAARRELGRPLANFKMLGASGHGAVETRAESSASSSFRARSSSSGGAFRGEIEADGRLRVFDDPEEYARALRALRGRSGEDGGRDPKNPANGE